MSDDTIDDWEECSGPNEEEEIHFLTPEEELEQPDNDSITTIDHCKFYQYGRLVFTLDIEEDTHKGIKRELDKMQLARCLLYLGSRQRSSN